ncbi:hypothetical protein BM1_07704 [Bipolaris maydis]|nr:hypothetical protein BM1_07704 [Bipolaris maydis]
METMPSCTNSHTSLPKLSMSKHVQRRDSLSSSRTRDSGYNSDPDPLSPLEVAVLEQDLFLASFPRVPSILLNSKPATLQSIFSFDTLKPSGLGAILSDDARASSDRGISSHPATSVSDRGIPRSFPCSPPLENVAGHGPAEILQTQTTSQDEDIERWVNDNLPSRNRPEQRALSIVSISSTSSCDMYTSTDVSEDEDEYRNRQSISQKPRSTLKVIDLIIRKVEISLRYAAYKQCAGNNTPSSQSGISASTGHSRKTSSSSGPKRKTRQDGSPPPEDDDEDRPNKRRRGSITTFDGSDMGARFACPFYKHDPNRYRNRRTCPGPGWTTVHRMKEHLYRSHAQPIFCPICYAKFKSDKEQLNHVRLQQCERSSTQQIDGIDRETIWTLRKRTTGLRLEEDKWRDVYHILFPGVPTVDIPSPFYDCDSPSEDSRRFRRDLLRRVQEELHSEAEQMPSLVEQQLLQRVAEIIHRCEQGLLNQSHPHHTSDFNTDRRASASSIGSSYQATPASAPSPPPLQSDSIPVAPVLGSQGHILVPMTFQDTAQYIPEPIVDFTQTVYNDQPYDTFSLGIDWDDVFSPLQDMQYRKSSELVANTMRPATRTSLVEFRSILLPPIRIPVRALGALYRPQCSRPAPNRAPLQCLMQRRGMNLYKTAKSKTLLGQHKSLTFSPYQVEPPSASSHRINLFETDRHHSKYELIAKDVSLQEAYDNYVKPGHMIYCLKQLKKGMAKMFKAEGNEHVLDEYNRFSFVEAKSHRIPLNSPQKGRQLGGLKNVIFNESSPLSHYRLSMDRAYQFIESGSPVEFRIRLQGSVAKAERLMPGDPTVWPWMHARFPHLRPDFILKGMPEGTTFLINPVSDGRVCQWVMAKPTTVSTTQDLNRRFEKVQKGVVTSIKKGQQEMLPQQMRLQLAGSGNQNYSPNTGLPRSKAKAKYGKGGDVTYGAEEKKHLAKDAETYRFLQPDVDEKQGAEDKGGVEKEDKQEDEDEDGDEFRPRYRYAKTPPPEPKHRWLGRGSRR